MRLADTLPDPQTLELVCIASGSAGLVARISKLRRPHLTTNRGHLARSVLTFRHCQGMFSVLSRITRPSRRPRPQTPTRFRAGPANGEQSWPPQAPRPAPTASPGSASPGSASPGSEFLLNSQGHALSRTIDVRDRPVGAPTAGVPRDFEHRYPEQRHGRPRGVHVRVRALGRFGSPGAASHDARRSRSTVAAIGLVLTLPDAGVAEVPAPWWLLRGAHGRLRRRRAQHLPVHLPSPVAGVLAVGDSARVEPRLSRAGPGHAGSGGRERWR